MQKIRANATFYFLCYNCAESRKQMQLMTVHGGYLNTEHKLKMKQRFRKKKYAETDGTEATYQISKSQTKQ